MGSYADYQSALDKMDVNEQMKCIVGVTDRSHSLSGKHKVKRSGSGLSLGGSADATDKRSGSGPALVAGPTGAADKRSGSGTVLVAGPIGAAGKRSGSGPVLVSGPTGATDRKTFKNKRAVKQTDKEAGRKPVLESSTRGTATGKSAATKISQENGNGKVKKKQTVRAAGTYMDHKRQNGVKGALSFNKNTSKDRFTGEEMVPIVPIPSAGQTSDGPAAGPTCSNSHSESTGKTKRVKRRKKSPEQTSSTGLMPVISQRNPDDQMKSRPEALQLSDMMGGDNTSVSDGPDTGDVQHMLDVLLHPPALSLVTPIATPKNTAPFIFPTSASKSGPSETKVGLRWFLGGLDGSSLVDQMVL